MTSTKLKTSHLILSSGAPEHTVQVGADLGMLLARGDVVGLIGELGAGKTTLIQGIVRGLGVGEEHYITSPTFTLINEYEGRVPVFHLDFYRLDSPAESSHLGLEEYLYGDGVALIEWADKIDPFLPEEYLLITMAFVDFRERRIEFSGTGKHYGELITALSLKLGTGSRAVTG